jgi:glycerol-3-phosphate dehydrogenase
MFSIKERANVISKLPDTIYDLVVIGGGITGCGIALDAASRGMKVLVIEKNDIASGTSSKSTKLIHGGLRYLKNFEFKLVHEVGSERAIVHRIARNIVRPEQMLLPIFKDGSLGYWATNFGLWLYDLLAGVKRKERRKMLSKSQTLDEMPELKSENLIGGGLYYEYRTDDARLTISVLKTAVERYKADAITYMTVVGFDYVDNNIVTVNLKDSIAETSHIAKGTVFINASGPWLDSILHYDEVTRPNKIIHSKGVHIVVERNKFPLKHAIYFDTPDQRMVFAIPRGDRTYIGTTDTFHPDSLDNPSITDDDRNYLINAVTNIAKVNIVLEDIISEWSGVRPLVFEEGKNASEISRHDEILISKSGLVSIAGGKLTGYRLMAEQVVDKIIVEFNFPKIKSDTKNINLIGSGFENEAAYSATLINYISIGKTLNISEEQVSLLFHKYGTEVEKIFNNFNTSNDIVKAEREYTEAFEMVMKDDDFWLRRSGRSIWE